MCWTRPADHQEIHHRHRGRYPAGAAVRHGRHPPGRLKVDREELNLEGRRCLICGGPAKVCSSRRIHTVAELQEKTTEILTEARDAQDIADAARLAVRACSTK